MLSVFKAIKPAATRLTPRIQLTSPQVAWLLAMERVCQAAGLWVVCDRCARERGTYSHLVTQNASQDAIWTVDCPCTERRFDRSLLEHTMAPSGDLLLLMDHLLAGTGLAVRCPNKISGCLTTPLSVKAETDGVTARCQCWQMELGAGMYRFRKQVSVQ